MWKKTTLALLAAAAMGGSMLQPASAQYQNPDCTFVQLNGNLNPGMPPDWVHDPVTQAWLAPNSPQARQVYQRHDACLRSQPNYEQLRAEEAQRSAYENQQRTYNQQPAYNQQYGYGQQPAYEAQRRVYEEQLRAYDQRYGTNNGYR